MRFIGPKLRVPGNASRLFQTRIEALSQPEATVQLVTSDETQYIFNSSFNSNDILYDSNYCTSEPFHFKQSQSYFDNLFKNELPFDNCIEIGCGQGEFVEYLRLKGVNAFGFDPVLRKPKPYLFDELWSINMEQDFIKQPLDARTMYVMRCVLPHIPEPFQFLDGIFETKPNAIVLLEFQRREWIEKEKVWAQVSHDHVNIFSSHDFSSKYQVLAQGNFSSDEWVYILLTSKKERETSSAFYQSKYSEFEKIFSVRENEISLLANAGRTIAIYGAAGKGIVLAYSLKEVGFTNFIALDSDTNRHNLFMECSGARILGPQEFNSRFERDVLILVANPNHYSYVKKIYQEHHVLCIGKVSESLFAI